jgi:hypothetical protein
MKMKKANSIMWFSGVLLPQDYNSVFYTSVLEFKAVCTTKFNNKISHILPATYIFVFRIDLRTNKEFFHIEL